LHLRADFDRVFQRGRHNSGRLMAVRSVANEGPLSRYAYAISKRVGKAVVRNKVRRRLREALRSLPIREGFDIVITARPEAALSSYQDLRSELALLLQRARLLTETASLPEQP
jgi:ribonuclease P protein component